MKRFFTTLALAACAFTASSKAAIIYDITGANGGTAEALFTFGTNSLTLQLKDTSVDPGGIAYNLSGIYFVLAGATGGTVTGASSPFFRTVAGDGTYVDTTGPNTYASVGWGYSTNTNGANSYKLDVLDTSAGPAQTIVGLPAADNKYDAGNGSLGNKPHNPFLANSATFTFTFTGGVTDLSLPSNVDFQFGSVNGTFEQGTCSSGCDPGHATPEPATYATLLSGLGFAGLLRKWQMARKAR